MITMLCVASHDYCHQYRVCIQSQVEYCDLHGLQHELVSGHKADHNWKRYKVRRVADIIESTGNDVIMIDADCMMTPRAPQPDFVTPTAEIYFAVGKSRRPNTGFVYWRNTEFVKSFLREFIARLDSDVCPEQYKVTTEGENGHFLWMLADHDWNTNAYFGLISRLWNCSSLRLESEAYVLHFTNHLRDRLVHYNDN